MSGVSARPRPSKPFSGRPAESRLWSSGPREIRLERRNFASGAKWESVVGYSRVVRVGPFVYVAGTTAWDEAGEIVGAGDPYAQTVQVLRNIEKALASAGAGLKDVVRTRTFVTNLDDWEQVGRAHGEVFREIRPAATMVEVKRLLDSRMRVEMEVDAVLADAPG